MRKLLYFIPLLLVLASCGEYTKVLKSHDVDYKFDYAKRAYDQRKYLQASTILSEIVTPLREAFQTERKHCFFWRCLIMKTKIIRTPQYISKHITTDIPRGNMPNSRFYSGYGYYLDSPDPQLDQTNTIKAIEELQGFLDYFPKSDRVTIAQNAIFEMQDKLTLKELQNAQLYYNLGNYMGNNYESAIIVSQNALKDYPYSKYKEDFELLILKSKFQEAKQSINERQADRYRDVVDEYYSFINNYPDSKHKKRQKRFTRSQANMSISDCVDY